MIIGILFLDHWSGSMFGNRRCYVYDIGEVITEDQEYLCVLLHLSYSTWGMDTMQMNKVRILKSAIIQVITDDLLKPVIKLGLKLNDIEHKPFSGQW